MKRSNPSGTLITRIRQIIDKQPVELRELNSWSALDKWTPRYATPSKRGRTPTRPAYGGLGSYQIAGAFLSGCRTVEDWGCGHGTFRDYCYAQHYIGIDGSVSPAADRLADLLSYRSEVQGILLRHVIEHNPDGWERILRNAMESFTKRLVLVIFTPFGDRRRNLRRRPPSDTGVPVAMSFHIDDITAVIPPDLAWFTITGGVLDRTETMFLFDREQPGDRYGTDQRQIVYRPNWRQGM
jgi:hypothetical protein